MPIFKKSASDSGRLNESYRKVLQRYRFRLVKDIDVAVIFDYLPADEGFKSDIKEQILSFPTKEERNGALLDRLETRGDRAFNLFLEALNEKYKHLAFTLESCLRSIDDVDQSDHEQMSTVQGDAIRRILLKNQKKIEASQYGESADDLLDDSCYDRDFSDYISCYTVPMRGKLQRDSWIKESSEPFEEDGDAETTFMGRLVRNLIFREMSPDEIPEGVRRPTAAVKVYVVEDNDSITDMKLQDYQRHYSRSYQQHPRSGNHRHAKDPLPPKPRKVNPPPPVPPKSLAIQSNDIKQQSPDISPPSPQLPTKKCTSPAPEKKVNKIPTPPKPPPLPRHRIEEKESSSSPEPNAPPVPPRISSAGTKAPLIKPPLPTQEPEEPVETPKVEKPLPAVQDDKEEEEEEDIDDDLLMSKEIPAPDTEEDSSVQTVKDGAGKSRRQEDEDYEVVGVSEELISKRDSSEITEHDSGILNSPKEGPADNGLFPRHSRSATPASMARSSSDSDRDNTLKNRAKHPTPPPKLLSNAHMTKQWCDEAVLPKNTSDLDSDGDSFYEDIDALDTVKSHLSSNAYLHPRSMGRAYERRQGSIASSMQTSTLRTMLGNYVELHKNDLLIVELEETVDEEMLKVSLQNVSAETQPAGSLPVDTPPMSAPPSPRNPRDGKPEIKPKPDTRPKEETQPLNNCSSAEDASMSTEPVSVSKTVAALESSASAQARSPPRRQASFLVKEKKAPEASKFVEAGTQYDEEPTTSTQQSSAFENTYLCYDKLGRAFYIKKEYVKHFHDLSGEPWFYPVPLSSQQATLFLRMADHKGCFLVYKTLKSTAQRPYNLSVCFGKGDVLHYHIIQNAHRDFMIEGHDHSFMNVQELVGYFKRNKSQLATRLRRPLKEVDMPISPGYHYDIQYELKRKDIALSSNIIGRGHFGVVCSGTYQQTTDVAVKVLQSGGDDHTLEEDAFVEEAFTMMGLKHEHIIQLVGISCSARPFFLVTEYIPNGSLRKCLSNATIPNDHIDILFDICLQATSAMCFLESRRYLLHRDLAARNLLITADMCIKLADFGRARQVADDNYQAERTEVVAVKWASPEVLMHSTYSTKSDVWSLGVLYWEILSGGELPYASMTNEQTAAYIIGGGRLEKPPGCSRDLFKIMKLCWNEQPHDRPSFAALYDTLKSKSSIYYSSDAMPKGKTPTKTKRTESLRNKTPLTPSAIKKLRHKSDSSPNKTFRRSTGSSEQQRLMVEGQGHGDGRKPSEALPTSSSETSLSSNLLTDKDDLTRGNKIRKSLRKMMTMKSKKNAMKSGLNGTPEDSYNYA